MLFRNKLIKQA